MAGGSSSTKIGPDDDQYLSRHGTLPVTEPDWHSPLGGAGKLGVSRNPDYNGAVQ